MNIRFRRVEILRTSVPGAVVMNQLGAPIAVGVADGFPIELVAVDCEESWDSRLAVLVMDGTSPELVDEFLRNINPVTLARRGFDPAIPLVLDHSPSMTSRVDVRHGRDVPVVRPQLVHSIHSQK